MEKVFKWMTAYAGVPESNTYLRWFMRAIPEQEFKGIDLALYCFLNFCSELRVTPKRETLASYIKTDLERDVKKHNIRLESMTAYDYSQVSQFKEAVHILGDMIVSTFDMYTSQDLTGRDFRTDISEYFNECQSEQTQNAFMDYYPKLSDGSNPVEVSEQLRSKLTKIEKIYDRKKLKKLDSDLGIDDDDDEQELEFLCNTGVPCIDGDSDGIYTHLMTTLNAQPGGGKTRFFLTNYAYPVLTKCKRDVYMYETELTKSQVKNILIAFHITQIYGGEIKIPDSIMNKKRLMTEEQKQIYNAAKYDLFKSGKYGKFIFNGSAVVEEMDDELRDALKTYPNLGLIGIDYMGLIKSVPQSVYDKVKEQYQIITEAYEIVREILKEFNIHAVCINQYNDKGIDAAEAGKPIRSGMTQGGHIVFRHTDYDLNLTCTNEQKLANVRMLSTGKTRGGPGFNLSLIHI